MSIVQIAHSLRWQGWHRHGMHWRGSHRHQRSDRGWIALVKMWWRRMQDRRTLATMSEQSLRDIGITRCDAFYEARKPFWRD
jgi:uncharacterized protein YjiS (DUF1127 family)